MGIYRTAYLLSPPRVGTEALLSLIFEDEKRLARLFVGLRVGLEIGAFEGFGLGMRVGRGVGAIVGDGVGLNVGDTLGDADIAFVVPSNRNLT